jgi:hypothetical protein
MIQPGRRPRTLIVFLLDLCYHKNILPPPTGDTQIGTGEMAEADIILSTPEKWDSVSRKWKEMENFVCSIKLLMVDEIHFIRCLLCFR